MRYPLYKIEHPYPVQTMRQYPSWVRVGNFFVWMGVLGFITFREFSLWAIAVGIGVTGLTWWLVQTQIRCPQCDQRLESRGEMDIHDNDHLFYDCHTCRITFDPKFSESPGADFDSGSES